MTELPANADGCGRTAPAISPMPPAPRPRARSWRPRSSSCNISARPRRWRSGWMSWASCPPGAAALTEENLSDPIYGPLLKGLEYAHTTRFVDEAAQRQVTIGHGQPRHAGRSGNPRGAYLPLNPEQKIIDDAASNAPCPPRHLRGGHRHLREDPAVTTQPANAPQGHVPRSGVRRSGHGPFWPCPSPSMP